LVFARFEGLVAVPFDLKRHETMGEPVVVLDDVYNIPALWGTGLAAFDVSDSGVLVYVGGGAEAGENRLVWIDRDGRTRPSFGEPGAYEWPRLSPDGKKIAVTNRTQDGSIDVWVLDIERDTRMRLSTEANDILPVWTPDGKRITFASLHGDSRVAKVYWRAADGSGETTMLIGGDHPRFPRDWSADGNLLAFVEWNPETMRDIWLLDSKDGGEASPLLASPYDEFSPAFSPDGHWLAYVSNESGRYEVYVESLPRGKGRWPLSSGGGLEPLWSADGSELFYRSGDAMISVAIQSTPAFNVGAQHVLFKLSSLKTGLYNTLSYAVTTDGEFLMIERQSELVPNQLKVVLNWDEELQSRVPTNE
jgi:Tol biopolymer transport system component